MHGSQSGETFPLLVSIPSWLCHFLWPAGSFVRDVMVVLQERCFAVLEPLGAVVTSIFFQSLQHKCAHAGTRAHASALVPLCTLSTSILPFPHLFYKVFLPEANFLLSGVPNMHRHFLFSLTFSSVAIIRP